jgi:hypothetical protein
MYGDRLSEWERNEIRKYPEVWFMGLEASKVQAKANLPNNCGFDDENGSYNKVTDKILLYSTYKYDSRGVRDKMKEYHLSHSSMDVVKGN